MKAGESFKDFRFSLQHILSPTLPSNCCVRIGLDGGSEARSQQLGAGKKLWEFIESRFSASSPLAARESFRESQGQHRRA